MPKPRRHQDASPPANVGRNGLNRQRLVDEALVLLQETGLVGLSTRRLAERLNVQSPALYWHVRNKDELLQLVADAICEEMALPAATRTPRERLEAIAHEYRRVLKKYRDAPRLFAEQPPLGRNRIRLYDVAVGAFLDGGLPTSEAVAMATFYRHYLLGMITEEMREQTPGDAQTPFDAFALGVELARHPDAARAFPNLAGAAGFLTSISSQQLFDMGLKVLLDGLDAHLRESR